MELSRIIQQIEGLTDYDKDLTFNVGRVRGGEAINRVAQYAEAFVEMRALSPEVFKNATTRIQNVALDDSRSVVNVEILSEVLPWPENEETKKLLEIWRKAGEAFAYKPVERIRGGVSDANLIWSKVPTLDALGSAGLNAHCSERSEDGSREPEYTEISSFVPRAAINTLAIVELTRELKK